MGYSGSGGAPFGTTLAAKAPCKYATTGALPANTYAGAAQTLTANANGALSVDGSSPAVGDRVLVKNEATQTNNGWYTVTATGSAGAKWVLTRAVDASTSNEIAGGDQTWIELGTANAGTLQAMSNESFATLDTDNIAFTNIALGVVLAGDVTGPANANTVVQLTGSGNAVTVANDAALSIGTSASRVKALNLSAGAGAGVFMYSAASDANAAVGLAAGQLAFGAGGASALDVRLRRSAANTFQIDNFAGGAASLLGGADNMLTVGTAASRLAAVAAVAFSVFAASADANASAQLGSNALRLGAGAATALDVKLTRSAVATLQIDNNAGAAATVVGPADVALTLGTTALRLTNVIAAQANLYNAASDANAQVQAGTAAGGGFVSLGVGGATALDVRLQRTAANTLTIDNNAGGALTLRFPANVTINATPTQPTFNLQAVGNTFLTFQPNAASPTNAVTISVVNPAAGVTYTIADLAAASTFLITPANVSLGAGGAATLGTVGSSGPAATAQTAWFKVKGQDGTVRFIPFWT